MVSPSRDLLGKERSDSQVPQQDAAMQVFEAASAAWERADFASFRDHCSRILAAPNRPPTVRSGPSLSQDILDLDEIHLATVSLVWRIDHHLRAAAAQSRVEITAPLTSINSRRIEEPKADLLFA